MQQLPYRAVIVDLDRTLLRTDKSISAYTEQVLREWEASGAGIYVATARPERAIADYRGIIPFRSAVTLNGARIITPTAVYENPISPDSAASLLERLCLIEGTVISAETGNGIYANTDIPAWNPTVIDDMRMLPGNEKIYKILASHVSRAPDRMSIAAPEDVYSTVADRNLIQFMSRSATKWNGIRQILQEDRIRTEESIYFGDDNDDVEPIRMCGFGVAVSNALEHVKQIADAVTGSNDDDGVAKYLAALRGL